MCGLWSSNSFIGIGFTFISISACSRVSYVVYIGNGN